MKKIVVIQLILILILIPILGFGQEWAPIGAKWYYDHFDGSQQYLTTIESIKDTIVLEKNCKILLTERITEHMRQDGTYYWDTSQVSKDLLYCNQDTIFHFYDYKFYPLYIFNLPENDTVIVRAGLDCAQPDYYCYRFEYVVDSTKTTSISGKDLKLIYNSLTDNSDWAFNFSWNYEKIPIIEKIGSSKFFFGVYRNSVLEGDLECLRCYNDKTISYKAYYWNKDCEYLRPLNGPSSIREVNNINTIVVYPNPFDSEIKIPATKKINYEIYNSEGSAIEQNGPRTVVFRVSGTFELTSDLKVTSPNLTVAGQTAPGDGICLKNKKFLIAANDVIVRHLRLHRGKADGERDDSLAIEEAENVIVDHCTMSWGTDDTLNTWHGSKNTTVLWSIVSEELHHNDHGFAATLGGVNASYHHLLIANCPGRNPSVAGNNQFQTTNMDFRNSVIFNFGHRTFDGKPNSVNVTSGGGAPPSAGGAGGSTKLAGPLLDAATFKHYVDTFNTNDADEAKPKLVPNAQSWDWIMKNAPLFESSNEKIEQIYYFRWWSYRKHITKQEGYSGLVMTEFYSWGSANSSAYCHQLAEGRWMRDKSLLDDLTLFWYRHSDKFHKYSQWSTEALYQRYLVNHDKEFIVGLLDDLVDDFKEWEASHKLPSGLFWSYDVRDAMEESISGSRTDKNARPTMNSYMAANAKALAKIAALAGRTDLTTQYQSTFESLRQKVIDELWDPQAKFFKVLHPDGNLDSAREAIGFIPWMFGLPGPEHEDAWLQIRDPEGFLAPKGLTTAERRHPQFRKKVPEGGTCEWDGAVWPFATSQTLNALATLLRSPGPHPVDKGDYYTQLLSYATSHEREGIPHIGEYQDEVTGRWLRDEYPRSWFYNHSTFVDLVIGGLVGLVPRDDDTVEVDPLVPPGVLDWFALDQVLYHGHLLTILWDKDGSRYGQGAGLRVYSDGQLVAHAPTLTRVTGNLTRIDNDIQVIKLIKHLP